jgi:hypothetical protein
LIDDDEEDDEEDDDEKATAVACLAESTSRFLILGLGMGPCAGELPD